MSASLSLAAAGIPAMQMAAAAAAAAAAAVAGGGARSHSVGGMSWARPEAAQPVGPAPSALPPLPLPHQYQNPQWTPEASGGGAIDPAVALLVAVSRRLEAVAAEQARLEAESSGS
ncbi:hypothetical protein GPECTOR_33g605 [Gonium pectorale]|uniref:Uncharacterized protein n=1 Tax=Gonium pectorale TaxID=33097 RepID=A0A150GD72_GONPE|nr:hypothetical protein GPECTOR_33g605 [Gonium pectorale]|eukprot:KXZ47723.1 hypothetical protein GPECTOR_33g605 [Gonium pectorale]